MKKKLIVLGMAGALLFSGLSVSAAVNDECGHPSRTEYVGTETRNPRECGIHGNCTVWEFWRIETTVCHYCQQKIIIIEKCIGEKHIPY